MDNERYEPVPFNTQEAICEWMIDPEFKTAYNDLEDEFRWFDALHNARMQAGLTQAQVAEQMGSRTDAVARLEAGEGKSKHSPSLPTLRRYANAVGCRLAVRLVPVGK